MPPIAWEASRYLTHTVLVACWVPVSLLIVVQLPECPSTRGYLAFGLVTGWGLRLTACNRRRSSILTTAIPPASGRGHRV